MTEIEQLVAGARPNGRGALVASGALAVPVLPVPPLPVAFREDMPRKDVVRGLTNLASLSAEAREGIEQRVFAFYLQQIEDGSADFATAQDQLNWERDQTGDFPDPIAPLLPFEVWRLMRLTGIDVHPDSKRASTTVEVSGKAAWDGEHGIHLHFRDGWELIDVTGWGVLL